MKHVGVVITDRGSAIVSVERSPEDALLVTGIERLPFDLAAVTDRVHELEAAAQLEAVAQLEAQEAAAGEAKAKAKRDPQTNLRCIIDAEGLGSALWAVLGRPDDEQHWQLYAGRGLERQALVDELLVAIQEDRFRFAPGLTEQAAMGKALQGYRRQVREDGLIGSELVVALLLALIPPPPPPVEPWVLFGRPMGRDW